MSPQPGRARFRLRGEVAGEDTFFFLAPGENRVGRGEENEIVLAVHGVSRRHAVFHLVDGVVEVEDLGSKNGVVVDGRRVGREPVAAGARITLGSVSLTLEAVEAGDAALGIEVAGAAGPRSRSAGPAEHTTSYATAGVPALQVVRLIERFVEQSATGLSPALSELCDGLGAAFACLLETRAGGRSSVLAGAGTLEEAPIDERLEELIRSATARATPDAPGTAWATEAPEAACAVRLGAGETDLALAVFGPLEARPELEPLLRALVQITARLSGDSGAARPRRRLHRELVFPGEHVPGRSPAMRSLYDQMSALVQGDLPVLLAGETGVGKEHLAQCLHLSSARASGPFVAINCAAIPAELLEAEMFGVAKGAATGVSERKGKFEQATGGTLLLDEVGDMPLELQAKLLRALQQKEIQPVGGTPVSVDIRVVSATNANLLGKAEEGRFRRDLYYRIAGYVLTVPPLRERVDDLPPLIEDFLRRSADAMGKSVRGVSVKALDALRRHRWPGNVRELEHEVRRMVTVCPDGQAVDSTMLSSHVVAGDATAADAPEEGESLELDAHVAALEERLIRAALTRAGGNRSQAARLLGVSRNGLGLKLSRLGIED